MQKSNTPMILIRKVDYGTYFDLFDIKEFNQLYLEVLYLISHHLIFPILQYYTTIRPMLDMNLSLG